MFDDIKLYNPDFAIDCSSIRNCKDIYTLMRSNKIKNSYVYGMCFKDSPITYDFLKVGMSSPSLGETREYQVGERITRQLAWMPGWQEEPVRSSNGSDFWMGIANFLIPRKQIPAAIDKNSIVIAVWDVSKRMIAADILPSDEPKATGWAEGTLAMQYKDKKGRLPYLNVQDPSRSKHYRNGHTPKTVWDSNFS
jgi:hypothetical protein